ncbi:hypothetical protein N7499_007250 [Penicillium canescens]|nr:hypothetical protein N7522_008093 [Penicillium canescens]KAJ6082376.1 hypothetical protein N7499_007250 [Penicillium canescens]KAJ6175827.1 hypothetical protein N7485_002741 [Penicillium canescens]
MEHVGRDDHILDRVLVNVQLLEDELIDLLGQRLQRILEEPGEDVSGGVGLVPSPNGSKHFSSR